MKDMKTLTVNGTQYNVVDDGAVRFDGIQSLTNEQKTQARENIGAVLDTITEATPGLPIQNDTYVLWHKGTTGSTSGNFLAECNVFGGDTIKLVLTPGASIGKRGAAFFRGDGTFCGEASSIEYVAGQTEYEAVAPSDAVTMKVTYWEDGFTLYTHTNANNHVAALKKYVTDRAITPEISLPNDALVTGAFVHGSTGAITAHSDYSYYVIPVVQGITVSITPMFTHSSVGAAFYTAGGAFLSGSRYTTEEIVMETPKNAACLKVSWWSYYPNVKPVVRMYIDQRLVAEWMNKTGGSNPLGNVGAAPSFVTMFRKIVHIGDSLTHGGFNTDSGNGGNIPAYSRPAIMEKMTGVPNLNLGLSGTGASRENTAKSWLVQMENDELFTTNPGDAYIVALGTNDISLYSSFTGDIAADINTSDYTQNAHTSVGGYAEIIQRIRAIQPKAVIFCVTIPRSRNTGTVADDANAKIKAIAEMFDCWVIDLAAYAEAAGDEFSALYKNDSHNNALGYMLRAQQYIAYIDWIIKNNPEAFRNVQFIGTDESWTAD